MTRKAVLCALAGATVAAGALTGTAAGHVDERSVSIPYERPQGLVLAEPSGETWINIVTEHPTVEAKRGDRALSVTITDDAGGTPHGDLHINLDGDPKIEVHQSFCGSTMKPVRVRPGAEIEVRVYAGHCADGSPAVATRGTVELTFH